MFIKDTDIVDIKIYYKKRGRKHIVFTENDFKNLDLKDDERNKYKSLSLKMQEMTWGLYNQLQEDAMVSDSNGNPQFNVKIYKENRLNKLIKEWDAKDEEGKLVPVAPRQIAHLAPEVAESILRAYDDISFIDEEEEGKL